MRRVYPPQGNADRHVECAEAIMPALTQLVDRAEDAGWTREETVAAIRDLSATPPDDDDLPAAG